MRALKFRLYAAFLSNMAAQRFLVMVNFRTLGTGEHRGDGRLAQGHPHLGAYYNIVSRFKLKMRFETGRESGGIPTSHSKCTNQKKKHAKKLERRLQQKNAIETSN